MSELQLPILDLGTPKPRATDVQISLSINGQTIKVAEGTSVLRAAALAGIEIPKLCATDSLDAFGSCRMCLVEIEGKRGLPASCTTPVEQGMVVNTVTDKLQRVRKNVMELYLSDHPVERINSPADGESELQDLAIEMGLTSSRYDLGGKHHQQAEVDQSNPYFSFNSTIFIF